MTRVLPYRVIVLYLKVIVSAVIKDDARIAAEDFLLVFPYSSLDVVDM